MPNTRGSIENTSNTLGRKNKRVSGSAVKTGSIKATPQKKSRQSEAPEETVYEL